MDSLERAMQELRSASAAADAAERSRESEISRLAAAALQNALRKGKTEEQERSALARSWSLESERAASAAAEAQRRLISEASREAAQKAAEERQFLAQMSSATQASVTKASAAASAEHRRRDLEDAATKREFQAHETRAMNAMDLLIRQAQADAAQKAAADAEHQKTIDSMHKSLLTRASSDAKQARALPTSHFSHEGKRQAGDLWLLCSGPPHRSLSHFCVSLNHANAFVQAMQQSDEFDRLLRRNSDAAASSAAASMQRSVESVTREQASKDSTFGGIEKELQTAANLALVNTLRRDAAAIRQEAPLRFRTD
jgi:hypothetical protein